MANFRSTRDLKEDVLFRASEATAGASDFDAAIIRYLNRVYRAVSSGASEFLPEYIEDWWWMRSRGVIYLYPIINGGTVAVNQGSDTVKFSLALVPTLDTFVLDVDALVGDIILDITGWRFRVDGHPDVFVIQGYDPGSGTATLDMPYTGWTNSAATFKLMKDTYELNKSVAAVTSPMIAFRERVQLNGMPPERMDTLWPLYSLEPGSPTAFALENETTVRFNRAGRDDGMFMRLEFRYRPIPDDLVDSDSSIPLVPAQYRHILADMALVYLLIDKNDERAAAANAAAKSGLVAMVRENRRRIAKIDLQAARIYARNTSAAIPRTEAGLCVPLDPYRR